MMGHTFLFRGSPKGRADSIDRWLSILAGDAALLADCAGGHSFARLSERLGSLAADRSRKGRTKYRGAVQETVEMLLARETAMVSSRSAASIYPSLVQHLRKKARYALRLVRSETQPSAAGGAAMQEVSFGLSLVRETAELCMRYLDPSERSLYAQADALVLRLADACGRAQIYGAYSAENGCEAFFAEADEAVCAYRLLLAELDRRCKEGRVLAVLPPTYLVWADEMCALVHHSLKQLARGRQIPDIADGLAEESEGESVRAEEVRAESECLPEVSAEQAQQAQAEPIVILAESAEGVVQARDESIPEKAVEEKPIESEEGAGIERICAKASDYKNIVAKTVQKQREHSIAKPRPLGRRG